jgi:hypothetical protein
MDHNGAWQLLAGLQFMVISVILFDKQIVLGKEKNRSMGTPMVLKGA